VRVRAQRADDQPAVVHKAPQQRALVVQQREKTGLACSISSHRRVVVEDRESERRLLLLYLWYGHARALFNYLL
jgi:hypothetical protein